VFVRCKWSPLGWASLAFPQPCRKRFYSSPNVDEDALVHFRAGSVWILHIPILHFVPVGSRESAFAGIAAHVDDQVGLSPGITEDRLRIEPAGRIAVHF